MNIETAYLVSVCILFLASPVTFYFLMKFPAPYGRHMKGGWGPSIKPRIAWCMMEAPAFFVFGTTYSLGFFYTSKAGLVFPILWLCHYFYRFAIYPFLQNSQKGMPITVLLSGFIFNFLNGFINGYYLGWCYEPVNWVYMFVGLLFFCTGFYIHLRSDIIIGRLKKSHREYQLPNIFLFRWICSPNYFGEIFQWWGFTIGVQSLPALAFAIFTMANLVPRAKSHLKWYQTTFPEFPENRFALVPFVW